jgi:hypothetical protein
LAPGGRILVEEQYFFASGDYARWFWNIGCDEWLYVDDEGASMSYDRMALRIDGTEIESAASHLGSEMVDEGDEPWTALVIRRK